MPAPVVHFEIIGNAPQQLRQFYGDVFGWSFEVGDASTEAVSEPGEYGFVDGAASGGINGGVGGGRTHEPAVLFYMGVDDVEAALASAEAAGGTRAFGPVGVRGELVVGRFWDPAGNLLGVAGLR